MDRQLTPGEWEINVSHEHEFLLWAPPRCGARFMYELLQPEKLHRENGDGSTPRQVVTHRIDRPEGTEGYYTLLLVRNPYLRALSLWKWSTKINQKIQNVSFQQFMSRQPRGWLSIAAMAGNEHLEEATNIIHLENWLEDVSNLPFIDREVPILRNRYRSYYSRRHKISYYTPGLLRRVAEDYAADFVIGDYDPDAGF